MEGNILTRVFSPDPRDPCFAIGCSYSPPRNLAAGAPWPGSVADIVIENNTITESTRGIVVKNVGGQVRLHGNLLVNLVRHDGSIGYALDPLPGANLPFTGNTGLNYAGHQLGSSVDSNANVLK